MGSRAQAMLIVGVVAVVGSIVLITARAATVVGDINNDGTVNVFDLSILLSHWSTNDVAADLNHDGIVNVFDLSSLLSHWGQTGAAGSTPTPTPSPTATPTPTPTGGITFNHCTNPTYTLPTGSDPNDGVTLSGYYITGDTWNFSPYPGSQQTMYACDYNNWYAMVNVNDNTHNGDVKSYPNVHKDFNNPAISTFNNITSTFAHTAPTTGDWDYSYDVWLNNQSVELMIWTQSNGKQAHVPCCSTTATTTIDGIAYNIHKSGGYIAYDMPTTMTSGTLNIKHILNDMVSRGYITNSATLGQIDYGVETCNTNSVNTRFEVNNFSVTTN